MRCRVRPRGSRAPCCCCRRSRRPGPLLRARAALPAGSAAARLADALLLLAGIASLAAGAASLRRHGSPARIVATLWGPALFGWGLGTAAGLQAGFAALVVAAVAGFALLEAVHAGAGPARRAALLAAASLPPFGGFAALVLLAEAALPTRPTLGVVFLVVFGVFSLAVLRVRGGSGRGGSASGGSATLVAALAVSVLLGVAMPAPVADALVDAAGLVAGGGG